MVNTLRVLFGVRDKVGNANWERQLLGYEERLCRWHKWTFSLAQKAVMLKTYL